MKLSDEILNEDIATLVGLHLGDGYISTWNTKWKNKKWIGRKWVLSAGTDYEFAVNVKLLLEKLGFRAKIYPKDKIYFVVQSCKVWRLLTKIFSRQKYAATADIPKDFLAWNLSKYVIKGFFSCDGCISFKKNLRSVYLSLDTKSPRLAKKIFKILKNQSFNVYYYHFKYKNIHSVRIYKKSDIKRFINEIGSLNPRHYLLAAGVR